MRIQSKMMFALALSTMAICLQAQIAPAQQSDDMGNMAGMKMPMPAAAAPEGAASAKLGALELSGGYVKAMLPGQPVGGGYLSIHNAGSTDDRLISVASTEAEKVELHEMTMQGDVMKMRELKDGIAIPAGGTVKLSPNTLHIMFSKLKSPFRQGGQVPVQLTFEKAGAVSMTFPVTSPQGK